MERPDPDEIALRLLCEKAEDRLERVEAARIAIEHFSRLPDGTLEKMIKGQQDRQPD
jgi:hypothetical protein